MDLHDELPPTVPTKGSLALAEDRPARTARPSGTRQVAGHPVTPYAFAGPERTARGTDTAEGDVR
ncbi:hypothetical protein [Streptomyces maremycinicus]|uniref:hypothetical protein n=1 Tax=Streptomyces maremycinicus TaxID=1679753 RepID=UPI0007877F38|nr:hypothetical protein [Streptomyces sp. NBRC 110468]